jgi:hypothetical protein
MTALTFVVTRLIIITVAIRSEGREVAAAADGYTCKVNLIIPFSLLVPLSSSNVIIAGDRKQ